MDEDDWQVWSALCKADKPVRPTEACKLAGWKATLSYSSTMERMLNHLVDEGWARESIRQHKIVYEAIRKEEEANGN